MATVLSSSQPYATPAELITGRDWRRIADAINTDDTRAAQADVLVSAPVVQALWRASGELETSCVQGGRYSIQDLTTIVFPTGGAVKTVARMMVVGIVCDLAYWYVYQYRHPEATWDDCPGARYAHEALQTIRKGEIVFPLDTVQAASVPETATFIDRDDSTNLTNEAWGFFDQTDYRRTFGG